MKYGKESQNNVIGKTVLLSEPPLGSDIIFHYIASLQHLLNVEFQVTSQKDLVTCFTKNTTVTLVSSLS